LSRYRPAQTGSIAASVIVIARLIFIWGRMKLHAVTPALKTMAYSKSSQPTRDGSFAKMPARYCPLLT
jgi:hypothetical protein